MKKIIERLKIMYKKFFLRKSADEIARENIINYSHKLYSFNKSKNTKKNNKDENEGSYDIYEDLKNL